MINKIIRSFEIKNFASFNNAFKVVTFFCMFNSFANANAQSVSFTVDTSLGCAPLTVKFTNTSTAGTIYKWNFGNGDTATVFDTTYIYTTAGDFTVTLSAFNNQGNQVGTHMANILVMGSNGNFNMSEDTICPNEYVSFSYSGFALAYLWDFGDGTTATDPFAYRTFVNTGNYTIRLIVTTDCGIDTIIKTLTVSNSQVPEAIAGSSTNVACPNDTINFYPLTWNGTFLWNFGDGTTSTELYTMHAFTDTGTHKVILKVTNLCGNSNYDTLTINIINNQVPIANLEIYSNPACPNQTVNFYGLGGNAYSWNFGDGAATSGKEVQHQYASVGNYDVSLIVTNGCGNKDTAFTVMEIFVDTSIIPVADFNFWPDSVCPGSKVYFEDYSSNADNVKWNFGDGTTSTELNPTHTYNIAGNYTVTLTAYSACGTSSSISKIVYVGIVAPETFPFHWPDTTCAGDTVYFMDDMFSFGDSVTYSYQFNFGDGNTFFTDKFVDLVFLAKHVYNSTGTYTISINVTNSCGGVTTVTDKVIIGGNSYPEAIAIADLSTDSTKNCPGDTVNFLGFGGTSFFWNFGDSTTSTNKDPWHIYADTGKYTISLIVTNGCGNKDTAYVSINVNYNNYPVAELDIYGNFSCIGSVWDFDNWSSNYQNIFWNLGDGTTSTNDFFQHSYSSAGTYSVLLIATNACGNDTAKTTIQIFNDPVASFTASDTLLTTFPDTVAFANTSTGATNYFWDFGDSSGISFVMSPAYIYTNSSNYLVTLTATNTYGCQDVTTLLIKPYSAPIDTTPDTTYINEVNNNNVKISIYPNPAHDNVFVSFYLPFTADIKMSVYDITGRRVAAILSKKEVTGYKEYLIDKEQLNINNGVYLLELLINDRKYISRMSFIK